MEVTLKETLKESLQVVNFNSCCPLGRPCMSSKMIARIEVKDLKTLLKEGNLADVT
jgi:hypothetical protein